LAGSYQPNKVAILITNKGTKTRKPQAALNPTPIQSPNIVSMLVLLILLDESMLLFHILNEQKSPIE
jgi:hypothetical protein